MNIVLWIGNAPNHIALANKINKQFTISGIVIESRKVKGGSGLWLMLDKMFEKLFLSSIANAWVKMQNFYTKNYPELPNCEKINVDQINSDEVYAFTTKYKPDLIIVSGTSLIKKKLLSIKPSKGILNLHTGLSPYIKGGPNCTNWCIATNQLQFIGNTIMWIDEGIDTGNLIRTESTKISGEESLAELHIKVMEHAHTLYLDVIEKLFKDEICPNVPQDTIAKGKTYYTKDWRLKNKIALVQNFKQFKKTVTGEIYKRELQKIKTV